MSNPLRVWWIPAVPGEPFRVGVTSPTEAKQILYVLASYDLFLENHGLVGKHGNAGGLEELVDGEWLEWTNEDGDSIDDVMEREEQTS